MNSAAGDQIERFLALHDPSEARLILDGTGPGLTMHFPALRTLGSARLRRFGEVHAFSGGVLAYLGWDAFESGNWQNPRDEIVFNVERRFRKFHHRRPWSAGGALANLVRRRPAFGASPIDALLRYLFTDAFLARPVTTLPGTFHPYLSSCGAEDPRSIHDLSEADSHALTLFDLIRASIRMPAVYGGGTPDDPYYDAVFAPGFRRTYHALLNDERPTLVFTMWRSGSRGNTTFVRTIRGSRPRMRLYADLLGLLLNVPRPVYTAEMVQAFR